MFAKFTYYRRKAPFCAISNFYRNRY